MQRTCLYFGAFAGVSVLHLHLHHICKYMRILAIVALLCVFLFNKIHKTPNAGPPKLRLSTLYACCQTININLIGMS